MSGEASGLEDCKKTVYTNDRVGLPYQCQRKAVKDGYCTQHHPDSEAARRKASSERYEAQRKEEEVRAIRRAAALLKANGWTVMAPSGGPTEG